MKIYQEQVIIEEHDEVWRDWEMKTYCLTESSCREENGTMTLVIVVKRKHISFFPSLKLTARTGKHFASPKEGIASFTIYTASR